MIRPVQKQITILPSQHPVPGAARVSVSRTKHPVRPQLPQRGFASTKPLLIVAAIGPAIVGVTQVPMTFVRLLMNVFSLYPVVSTGVFLGVALGLNFAARAGAFFLRTSPPDGFIRRMHQKVSVLRHLFKPLCGLGFAAFAIGIVALPLHLRIFQTFAWGWCGLGLVLLLLGDFCRKMTRESSS